MTVDANRTRSSLLEAGVAIPEHVVFRVFPSETVVLNLQTGKYHGLNPVAGRMLEELERQPSVAATAKLIADEYGEQLEEVESDVCQLCADLHRRGLVTIEPGA